MARRLHTDGNPLYRRRKRFIYTSSVCLLLLVLLAAAYLTHQAYLSERAEWWIGLVAIVGISPMAIFLANRWRADRAR